MEYFADLFAAQYINNASNLYINYIAHNAPDSYTHPSSVKRINLVNDFLNGKTRTEVTELNTALVQGGCEQIKIRYEHIKIQNSDFQILVPQKIKNIAELHYIFKLGWEFWETSETNFLRKLNPRQKYHVINNLIEKSISNYIVKLRWEEVS